MVAIAAAAAAFAPSSTVTASRLRVTLGRRMTSPSPLCRAEVSQPSGDADCAAPWMLVGLGNPGKLYKGTRHNVGFELLDAIAEAEGIPLSTVRFKALTGKGFIHENPVLLVKPQTFMNASGDSVSEIASYYKIPINKVLVMYDDLDLPFASLRLLPKGGHGGHNGMRSIIGRLKGSRDFPRLRIGIGRPPGKMEPENFVLRPFSKSEQKELEFTYQTGIDAIRMLMVEGFNKSATFVNSRKSSKILN